MKRRFSDKQIIGMIKEYEAKLGGMNVSDAKKLRAT